MVEFSIEERVGYITMNRPEKRNALNDKMVEELTSVFEKMSSNDSVKVIVLQGTGEIFCAGADLAYLESLQKNSYDDNLKDSNQLKKLFLAIYNCNKMVVCKMNGHAIAGGAGLVTACDIVFSAPEAKYGFTEVKIGFLPAIVMNFLIRRVGEGIAKELLLTGNLIEAKAARDYGIINYLFPSDELDSAVKEFSLDVVKSNSFNSMSMAKTMFRKIYSLPLEQALDYSSEMNAKARESEDCKKGIRAFLEKKKIEW